MPKSLSIKIACYFGRNLRQLIAQVPQFTIDKKLRAGRLNESLILVA